MTEKSVRKTLLAAVTLLLVPGAAHAHLTSTGLGPFYDGVSHFVVTPEEFIPALAIALFAGLRGSRTGRLALFLLPGAWLLGGLGGLTLPVSGPSMLFTCISFLVLGALVATDLKLGPGLVSGIASAFGFVHGYLDGSGMTETKTGVVGLLGSVTSLFILVALAAALVVSLRAPWTRIVVRVAGSWIVAAGLLLLGWTLHMSAQKPQADASANPQNLTVSIQGEEFGQKVKDSLSGRTRSPGLDQTQDLAARNFLIEQ
jgi:urease accessory protein